MNLFDQVSADIKAAMIAKDKVRLQALRGVKKEFLEAKTTKGSNGELSDDTALKILAKMLKQRKDSAKIYQEQGRNDLAEAELAEISFLESYMPKQLTEAELIPKITKIIEEVGATGPKDMGKVMGVASKSFAGLAEGRLISATVKSLLGKL